jgi:predicted nucleic acid-binding protein
MTFLLDASIAAAWFLPKEQHDAADRLMTELRATVGLVPTLFWFETRKSVPGRRTARTASPRRSASVDDTIARASLEDAGSGGDGLVLDLAARYTLTGYHASCVALAKAHGLPLATGDRKMAAAARNEGITIVGPLEHEH